MGTNRRYADAVDRQMNRRITEMLIKPQPITLSAEELDIETDPVKEGPPVRVRSWVRYPETVVRIEGSAVAWTTRAVKVEWEAADGTTKSTWVWASAVERY